MKGINFLIMIYLFLNGYICFAQINKEEKGQNSEIGSKERLLKHVTTLSEKFFPRNTRDNLNKTADYIKNEFELSGGRVSEQKFSVDNVTYRNIIVQIGPEDGPRIIVGAHYDSYKNAPGADDNASGVAGLIEIAHLLGKTNNIKRTIELIAYATEEPPFYRKKDKMGSIIHARSLKEKNTNVLLMVSLDQIGYFSNEEGSQRFPDPAMQKKLNSTKGNFIALISDNKSINENEFLINGMKSSSANLPIHSLAMSSDSIAYIAPSDILSYSDLGYHAVLITDTAPYRGSHRHTEGDTPAALKYNVMKAVVKSFCSALVSFANKNN